MLHGINSHVLTGANPFINNEIHTLLKYGFVTLTMSYQGHRIKQPCKVQEIFFRKLQVSVIGKEAFSYWEGMLCVILFPRDLHMSSQKQSLLKPGI